jgi:ribosomal protein S13
VFMSADPLKDSPISQLGKDSYTELPDQEAFCQLMSSQRRSIKVVLLDQAVLCGIGNWVADEVLYQAKLHPETCACDLDEAETKLLHTCIKDVLTKAVEVGADATRLPREWLFHYRCACRCACHCSICFLAVAAGVLRKSGCQVATVLVPLWAKVSGDLKPVVTCRWTGKTASKDANGQVIKFLTVGSRTSAYVPSVQINTGSRKKSNGASKNKSGAKKIGGSKQVPEQHKGSSMQGSLDKAADGGASGASDAEESSGDCAGDEDSGATKKKSSATQKPLAAKLAGAVKKASARKRPAVANKSSSVKKDAKRSAEDISAGEGAGAAKKRAPKRKAETANQRTPRDAVRTRASSP